ncbi:hypothetical protein Dxin01_04219 [Deinococcus xinjiangensis]|uniref:Uncharacterized protein n=1 Tax=Deinococcus xinjiangensis TaxID=457454 RepID=A0ABP9VGW2_9DEIO
MTIQTHKTEKKTLNVTVDGIKHSYHARGWPLTTLHLELASRPDLEFLQRAHAITKDKEARENVGFTIRVYQGGDLKTYAVTSRGSKTKDFKVVAVIELYFNANYRFEQLFAADQNADIEVGVPPENWTV